MTDEYRKAVDNFKPQFGNKSHVRAAQLIQEVDKGKGKLSYQDIETKKSQVINLINQK